MRDDTYAIDTQCADDVTFAPVSLLHEVKLKAEQQWPSWWRPDTDAVVAR
eukprot:COSAG01_NODE_53285_length_340_cov_0.875519_1_plen_49_part_10